MHLYINIKQQINTFNLMLKLSSSNQKLVRIGTLAYHNILGHMILSYAHKMTLIIHYSRQPTLCDNKKKIAIRL
jgi:hypothetical protein